jgi:hypothetical protein
MLHGIALLLKRLRTFLSRRVSSLFKCHTTFSYILIKWKVSRGDRQASKGFSLLSEPKIPEQKDEDKGAKPVKKPTL